jgi:hypothetical protein
MALSSVVGHRRQRGDAAALLHADVDLLDAGGTELVDHPVDLEVTFPGLDDVAVADGDVDGRFTARTDDLLRTDGHIRWVDRWP